MPSTLTSEHVRAARALLHWNQADLAKKSGVSMPTIARLEAQPGPLGGRPGTIAAIRRALEREGIRFISGDSHGVRRLERCREPHAFLHRSKPARAVRIMRPRGGDASDD